MPRSATLPPPAPRAWPHRLVASGLIFAVCLRAAWSTLDRYFLGDDFGYIGRFSAMAWHEWPALFVRDWSGGLWGYNLPELRPFAALTFLVDAHLWGANPLGYHLTNLALFTGCAGLVALIAWRLLTAPLWVGLAAGLLFACSPVQAEPVAWITGRVDLLGTLAYLAGFYAAGSYLLTPGRRSMLVGAWAAFFVGCFAKEFCLTLPVMLGLWLLVCRPAGATLRSGLVLFAGFALIVGLYAWCRHVAFATGTGGGAPLALFTSEYAERQMDYLRWLLPPLYDFGRDHRPALAPLASQLVLGALAAVVGLLGGWRWLARSATPAWRTAVFFGLLWYGVATLPMAAASYFSPRHLVLAAAGFSLAVCAVVAQLAPRRWLAFVLLVGACLCSVRCYDHAVASWRHAAKLSERFTAAVMHAGADLRPGEALVLDVPDVYEGVWLWSWSSPFALRPPFLPPVAAPLIEPPAVYFAPDRWVRPAEFAALARAPGAVLISADRQGQVTTQAIPPARLSAAARRLPGAASDIAAPAVVWQQFLRALRAP